MSTPEEFKPFFSALARRTIAFPRCEQCGRFHWYPMMRCPHCLGERVGWKDVQPKASVYTWTVYRHAFQPAWKTKLPYVVGVVEFDDAPGVRLVTQLTGATPESWKIGEKVTPIFDAEHDGVPLVMFERAPG